MANAVLYAVPDDFPRPFTPDQRETIRQTVEFLVGVIREPEQVPEPCSAVEGGIRWRRFHDATPFQWDAGTCHQRRWDPACRRRSDEMRHRVCPSRYPEPPPPEPAPETAPVAGPR
ncbi:MAG: hypothetical protein LIP77_08975, partial [Planctomycetes bacterium]|nr:hypothetical protein [Planctomycetota bacterium]